MIKNSLKTLLASSLLAASIFAAGCANGAPAETPGETAAQAEEGTASAEDTEPAAFPTEEEHEEDTKPAVYGDTASVTLGEYKNLAVNRVMAEVTEEEVDSQIEQVLKAHPTFTEVDRAAASGDTVNIDFVGKIGGEAFEGGSSEGYDLELGSGAFIAGFEDGVAGMKKGETKDIALKFPENYQHEDVAGKDVVFTVTLNAVKEKEIPGLTDEFVKSIAPDVTDAQQYRDIVKAHLTETRQSIYDSTRDSELLQQLLENADVVLTKADVDTEYNKQLVEMNKQAKNYGLDMETYAAYSGMTMAEFQEELRHSAENTVESRMVLLEIAKQENIVLTDDDRKALAEQYGYETVEELLEATSVPEEDFEETARLRKVMDFVVEQADVTEVKASEAQNTAG
ncbi:MAG: trigger factor [Clostridium sp.]|nr:trigger factor [Clostridium sp.]